MAIVDENTDFELVKCPLKGPGEVFLTAPSHEPHQLLL